MEQYPDLTAVIADPGNKIDLFIRYIDTYHAPLLSEQDAKILHEVGKVPRVFKDAETGIVRKGDLETTVFLALRPRLCALAIVMRLCIKGYVTPQTLGALFGVLPECDIEIAVNLFRLNDSSEFEVVFKEIYQGNGLHQMGFQRVLDNLPSLKSNSERAAKTLQQLIKDVIESNKPARSSVLITNQIPFLCRIIHEALMQIGDAPTAEELACIPRDLEAILGVLCSNIQARGIIFDVYSKVMPHVDLPDGSSARANLAEDVYNSTHCEVLRALCASQFVTYARSLRLARDEKSLVRTIAFIRPHMANVRKVYETLSQSGKNDPAVSKILADMRKGDLAPTSSVPPALGRSISNDLWIDPSSDIKAVALDPGVRIFLDLMMKYMDSMGNYNAEDPKNAALLRDMKVAPIKGSLSTWMRNFTGKEILKQQPIINSGFLGRQDIVSGSEIPNDETMPRLEIHGRHYFHGIPADRRKTILNYNQSVIQTPAKLLDNEKLKPIPDSHHQPAAPPVHSEELNAMDLIGPIPLDFWGPREIRNESPTFPFEIVEPVVHEKDFNIPVIPPTTVKGSSSNLEEETKFNVSRNHLSHDWENDDNDADEDEDHPRAANAARVAVAAMRAALRLEKQSFHLHKKHKEEWAKSSTEGANEIPHYNAESDPQYEDERVLTELKKPLEEENGICVGSEGEDDEIESAQDTNLFKMYKNVAEKLTQDELQLKTKTFRTSSSSSQTDLKWEGKASSANGEKEQEGDQIRNNNVNSLNENNKNGTSAHKSKRRSKPRNKKQSSSTASSEIPDKLQEKFSKSGPKTFSDSFTSSDKGLTIDEKQHHTKPQESLHIKSSSTDEPHATTSSKINIPHTQKHYSASHKGSPQISQQPMKKGKSVGYSQDTVKIDTQSLADRLQTKLIQIQQNQPTKKDSKPVVPS